MCCNPVWWHLHEVWAVTTLFMVFTRRPLSMLIPYAVMGFNIGSRQGPLNFILFFAVNFNIKFTAKKSIHNLAARDMIE